MADTTFLLGAGINRCIQGPDRLVPPLARDLFKQALRHPRIGADYLLTPLSPLFEFINKYWRRDRNDLATSDFDLEECFTFLELQRREAILYGDQERIAAASRLEWLLSELLLDFMSECEHWFHKCSEFRALAERISAEQATVLTFNYDTLLESAIESASPGRAPDAALLPLPTQTDRPTDDQIGFSWHEWNSYAAYGVEFDEVSLRVPGNLRMVDGARYFAHERNKFVPPRFLKLHGSLGWFFHSGYRIDGAKLELEGSVHHAKSVLRRSSPRLGSPEIDYGEGEILLPLVITPTLNKPYDQHPVFRSVWKQARHELRECRRLVIGGYSFPPTDFHVRRLLREVFCDGGPEELHIINPDTAVVAIAKDLCNYRKPLTVSGSVGEFLERGV